MSAILPFIKCVVSDNNKVNVDLPMVLKQRGEKLSNNIPFSIYGGVFFPLSTIPIIKIRFMKCSYDMGFSLSRLRR